MPESFTLDTSNHFNSLIGVTVLLSWSLMCAVTRWWLLPTYPLLVCNVSTLCNSRVQHNVSSPCNSRVWHNVIIPCDRRVWHYVSMAYEIQVWHSVSTARVSRIRHNVSKAYNIRERHNVIIHVTVTWQWVWSSVSTPCDRNETVEYGKMWLFHVMIESAAQYKFIMWWQLIL